MKLSRPVLILLAIVILGLLGSAFYLLQLPGEAERQAAMAEMVKSYGTGPDGSPFPLAYNTDELDENVAKEGILNAVRAGRINLPFELRKLRAECPRTASPQECNQSIVDYLYSLPEPDNQKLVELFNTYLRYEEARTDLKGPPGMDLLEKYEVIKKKRREIFGDDQARLVFGLEEANFAYQDLMRRFQSDEFAEMPPAERLRKLENQRRDLFGPYYETLTEREPQGTRYGLELLVRQTDLSKMPEPERDRVVYDLRVKYFGEEKADEITAAETAEKTKMAEKTARVDEFLEAEAEINKNQNLSVEEKREKIEKLRSELIDTGE